MKFPGSRVLPLLAATAFVHSSISFLHAVETPFTYQGRLDSNGKPFTGTITLRLSLWPLASAGGTPTRSEVISNVSVTNGLFTAMPRTFLPAEFGASFLGDWLQIETSTDGGSTFTKMTPLQRVTYAPLAITAERARGLIGFLPTSQLSGTISPSSIASGAITSTFTFSPTSGAPFLIPNTTSPVVVNLNSDKLDGLDSSVFLKNTGGTMTGSLTVLNPATIDFGSNTRQMISLWGGGAYGIGVQSGTVYQRTNDDFSWFAGGVHNDAQNNPGAGGKENMRLDNGGGLTLFGTLAGLNVRNRSDATKQWTFYSRNYGSQDEMAIYSNTGGDVLSLTPAGNMYLVGSLSTTVLTIRGGADVAEPFEMTRPDSMVPGSVVVIDEENAGKLKLSHEAYDTRVAGIISGAGGVKPGLRLHQEGVLEGDHHVALSGRVYVRADASEAPIRPGDLLTTSSNPGHAMKVLDPQKAQGAILGKAMSRLDESTGLVLVLVSLQ